jgi:uncharacterized protein (TIGR00369 family)
MNEHYSKLIRFYESAPSHQWCNANLKVDFKTTELMLQIDQHHFHGANAAHGSILFKLLDDACYFAAQSVEKEFFLLTTSFDVKFCRPVSSGTILAKGELLLAASTHLFAEAKIYDQRNKLVAFGSGEFARSKMRLSELEHF